MSSRLPAHCCKPCRGNATSRAKSNFLANALSHNILTYRDRITLVEMIVDLVSTHVIEIDLPAREFMKDERV
ncbi:MAG: hypothetical protein WCK94_03085 [Comamonadaceae bacterium]